jgi:pantoate--beta-alanine ligase
MLIVKRASNLHQLINSGEKEIRTTGFVPTMGALHEGHLSLIQTAKKENGRVICSIFVNPTQFNDPADYQKYPITIDNDVHLLQRAGCDVLFLPSVEEIYPDGTSAVSHFDIGYLDTILEGKYRPGHFQGVCMVINRLLNITGPATLYLGQKDFQQCMVIKKLLETTRMSESVQVKICPTLREKDGLAMSSRNMRLNVTDRQKANAIFQALTFIKNNLKPGNIGSLKESAALQLSNAGFKVDYLEITDAVSLQPIDQWNGRSQIVALAAAFLGEVRLIDNMLLN